MKDGLQGQVWNGDSWVNLDTVFRPKLMGEALLRKSMFGLERARARLISGNSLVEWEWFESTSRFLAQPDKTNPQKSL